MIECCARAKCAVVVMHSLGVPADRTRVLPDEADPVVVVRDWFAATLERVTAAGIDPGRVLLDPGIGFGKTPRQSLALLEGIDRLLELPARVIVGHSRKSFLEPFSGVPPAERDPETLAVSARLAERGVDVLRVHAPDAHQRFWRVYDRLHPAA
jgi:dihydropteroate synthase